jgi:hypothetical protein
MVLRLSFVCSRRLAFYAHSALKVTGARAVIDVEAVSPSRAFHFASFYCTLEVLEFTTAVSVKMAKLTHSNCVKKGTVIKAGQWFVCYQLSQGTST